MGKQGRTDAERTEDGEYVETLSLADVLDVFRDRGHEPLTATEVAGTLDCNRKTAYNKLRELADDDRIATKKVGARGRVWWVPDSAPDADTVLRRLSNELDAPITVGDGTVYEDGDRHKTAANEGES